MKKILGRSGNLRAPAMRHGKTFYIGYNDGLYQQLTNDIDSASPPAPSC